MCVVFFFTKISLLCYKMSEISPDYTTIKIRFSKIENRFHNKTFYFSTCLHFALMQQFPFHEFFPTSDAAKSSLKLFSAGRKKNTVPYFSCHSQKGMEKKSENGIKISSICKLQHNPKLNPIQLHARIV